NLARREPTKPHATRRISRRTIAYPIQTCSVSDSSAEANAATKRPRRVQWKMRTNGSQIPTIGVPRAGAASAGLAPTEFSADLTATMGSLPRHDLAGGRVDE